jgi:FeS assembly SUF system protein
MIDGGSIAAPLAGRSVPLERLREEVIAALRTIYDPEIPVNIYDLGLIYDLEIDGQGDVAIRMTLTAPACPVAQTFPETVASRLREVPGVAGARVELVWDPPWSIERITDDVRLQLGLL